MNRKTITLKVAVDFVRLNENLNRGLNISVNSSTPSPFVGTVSHSKLSTTAETITTNEIEYGDSCPNKDMESISTFCYKNELMLNMKKGKIESMLSGKVAVNNVSERTNKQYRYLQISW